MSRMYKYETPFIRLPSGFMATLMGTGPPFTVLITNMAGQRAALLFNVEVYGYGDDNGPQKIQEAWERDDRYPPHPPRLLGVD